MQPETNTIYAFDKETQGEKISDDHWQLNMVSDWNIGNNPNGGYILACLLRSMATLVPDTPDPISVTTHYLRPGLPGKIADLRASIVRLGRRTATVTGTMEQDGKPRITCTATFGNLGDNDNDSDNDSEGSNVHSSNLDSSNTESGNAKDTKRELLIKPPQLPPPEQCTTRSALGQAIGLPIMSRLDIRVDPLYAELGQHTDAVLTGWIRFRDERPVDQLALSLFCDAFPPAVFTLYGAIGWVPTIELAVHVRRRPQPGWIKAAFVTNDLTGDLFIEDGILWDENDHLVAQSRQLQMILR